MSKKSRTLFFLCAVGVYELLVVPYRTINLTASVEGRTPRAVFDIGLVAVPSLSPFVLHFGEEGHVRSLDVAAVGDRVVLVITCVAAFCGDDDHTV